MNNRRQSRETAFALIFEWSFKPDEDISELIENAKIYREAAVDDFADGLVKNTVENVSIIDSNIEDYLDSWKISRISKVALACLRLAICEQMYYSDIPKAVTANETIEIAKKYGTKDDASFINGILGKVFDK